MAADNAVNGQADSVFTHFRKICAIPHGSFHTKEISDYLVQFAVERGLSYRQDEADNVIIRCPATPGCEGAAPLILQGHMDMVLEKESDKTIDMEKEAITVLEDGDWIHADGTTLGGDNGIAVAMMLAVMDDSSIAHPPLECIFTSNEEVGMLGALALDLSDVEGRIMLNLDSEEEGVITAGCAGGAELHQKLAMKRRVRAGYPVEVRVKGLLGGHSGEAIRLGRANAILILARVLYSLLGKVKFRIVNIEGGGKDNAIPREACAQILLTGCTDEEKRSQTAAEAERILAETAAAIKAEYVLQDPGMEILWNIEAVETETEAATGKATRRCLQYLQAVPDGVLAYSPSFEKLPQTSLNLGILKTDAEGIETVFLVRSSIESQKKSLLDKLHCIASAFGVQSTVTGSYPAWEYRIKSPFRDRVVNLYERTTGTAPAVAVIHGGLECGLLSAGIPGLDAISMGPDMKDIHTPAERLSKSSTIRLWEFLLALLAELAQA